MTAAIFHLAEPKDWAASGDEYRASSLDDEGFIHCSTADQLSRTARDIFGDRNDLVLLTIDPDLLGGAVVYEDLYEAGENFPHIYGPLPAVAVIDTGPYLTHLEEGLCLPESRSDRHWMDRILHPQFSEVGLWGHAFTRTQSLETVPGASDIELPLDDYRMDLVDEDVALVRYSSRSRVDNDYRVEHSSLWINTNEGWRLRFHQATPVGQD